VPWPRPHSLLWTFWGAFLAVLAVGLLVQIVLFTTVLRPVVTNWRLSTRETAARSAAAKVAEDLRLGASGAPSTEEGAGIGSGGAAPQAALERFARLEPGLLFVYRDETGRVVASAPREIPPRILRALGSPPPSTGRVGRGPARLRRTAAIVPVTVEGVRRGEVLVFPRVPDSGLVPAGTPRPWILLLPAAAVLAGVAGFLLFRNLSQRLARLEESVRLVAEGDLATRIADGSGDEISRLGIAFNRMAEHLQRSRAELLDADAQRRRFLADVTHDLVTPLTSIRGYAETLLDPAVPKSEAEIARFLRFIEEEARRMDALLGDLLDLARAERGALTLQIEEQDLVPIVREEAARKGPAFAEAGMILRRPEPGEASIPACFDRRRVEQAVSNLLSNAARHASRGGTVEIKVLRLPDDDRIEVRVEDGGPGFRDEDLPRVFDRFFRGDPARTAAGTGLGLAIVRAIAQAHGGDAYAENRPEGGARVGMILPRTPRARS
jgi:signal transduction histidine kinase